MDDIDKTMPGHREFDGEDLSMVTMPGKRERKPDGRFDAGDLIMGRYEVLAELGQGGMGVVYKCFDKTAGIEIALKALPPELSHNTLEMEDIKDNFQLVHNLHHPNIASSNTLEKDPANGNYYLIMECVNGEDLRRWIKRKRKENALNLKTVLPVIRQVADALDYAHKQKIIHRDIKPGNIMIDAEGNVKVLDFGLAAQIHTSMTRVSMAYHGTSGTGPYMAPEQWKGRAQGAAADQYALAVMAYEMLAGHLPFESTDPTVLREAVLNESALAVDGVPNSINTALQKALSKEPAERFESCAAFANAMKDDSKGISGKPGKNLLKYWIAAAILVAVGVFCFCIGQQSKSVPYVAPSPEPKPYVAPSPEPKPYVASSPEPKPYVASSPEPKPYVASSPEPEKVVFNGTVMLPGNVQLEMVKVESGTFTMSKRDGENYGDEKEHTATLTKDFYIGKYELTQAQWQAVMGNNPSLYKGDNLPVEEVSWHEAIEFCEKLNDRGLAPEGWRFTLPTETQWEYAAVGGKKSHEYKYSGSNTIDGVGWYKDNSGGDTHPVGTKAANELGIYDMSGNVWEWCLDDYSIDSSKAIPEFRRSHDSDGAYRVYRGGSWNFEARSCRSAHRGSLEPGCRSIDLGFRLALVPK